MRITLVPYAGLCNRLNAILSGLLYMQMHPGTKMTIKWHKWFHCNCRFRDLFYQLDSKYPPVKEIHFDTFDIKNTPGHKLNLGIPDQLRHLFFDFSFMPSMSADRFDELTRDCKNVYVYKDNRFCKEMQVPFCIADLFRPKDDIQKRIDSITENWNHDVIGLHIRRTDNAQSIEDSPMSHFYDVIEKEMRESPSIRFYVASDDDTVKNLLIKKYGGNRIISPSFCLKRNNLQGMKDAVVDLYCLGKTNKIYGSAASTYSLFAAKLYGVDLIL